MSKRELIEGIKELLEDASESDVESVYWMVKMELA